MNEAVGPLSFPQDSPFLKKPYSKRLQETMDLVSLKTFDPFFHLSLIQVGFYLS